MSPEEYAEFMGRWYRDLAQGPLTDQIRPGDLAVADGDGAIVVPIEHVDCVLTQARRIANGDRAGRRKLLAAAGKPQDDTTAELL